jgi:hypothetical protein
VICLGGQFSCLKPLTFIPILGLHILFGCQFPRLFRSTIRSLGCKKDKWYHHLQQLKSSSTTRKLKMKPRTSSRLFGVEDMKLACLSDWLLWKIFESIPPRSTFHLWLPKTFDAYSVVLIIPSILSFQFYQILSSKRKLLIPSFPESRGEIPFKGGSLSHLEISISECGPFSSTNFNFQNDFILFKLKRFYLILFWVQRIKIFKWRSKKFLLNYPFIWVVKNFKQKVLSLKIYSKGFSSLNLHSKRIYKSL